MESGLADLLRERTRSLHARAERAGVIGDVLRGRAGRERYALLLRNLLPVYQRLEAGLELHRDRPGFAGVAARCVYRAPAIESDLRAIAGAAGGALPLLEAGERYADRVSAASGGDGSRLLAHAYTRFLGDLNGGRILRPLLARSLGLGAAETRFYDYPDVADLGALRDAYRVALDAAGAFADADAVADEAMAAFELNIEVSEQVRAADLAASG